MWKVSALGGAAGDGGVDGGGDRGHGIDDSGDGGKGDSDGAGDERDGDDGDDDDDDKPYRPSPPVDRPAKHFFCRYYTLGGGGFYCFVGIYYRFATQAIQAKLHVAVPGH